MRTTYAVLLAIGLLISSHDGISQLAAEDKKPTAHETTTKVEVFTESAKAADQFQLPNQELVVPTTVDPGEMVVAKVSDINNPPANYVGATYRWKVTENSAQDASNFKDKVNIQVWPGGTSIVFGTGVSQKKFHVVCSASYLYIVKDSSGKVTSVGQRAKLFRQIVTVGNPSPAPGPGPSPNPTPTPTFPDGKYGLSKTAWQMAMTSVPEANRVAGGHAIATSLNGVASQVAAGTLKNVKDILTAAKNQNQQALSSVKVPLSDWDSFFAQLQKNLYSLYNDNKINTVDDFATAFKEVAIGVDKLQ
jgi:hypothetical protein